MTERIPPHDLEAEAAVVGSMMLSPSVIGDVVEQVRPEDFYRTTHARVFAAVLDLFGKGEPVDVVSVVAELRKGDLPLDPLQVRDLTDSVVTPSSAAHHARHVADLAVLRRLITATADVQDLCYEGGGDPRAIADKAEATIYAASRQVEQGNTVTAGQAVAEVIDNVEALQRGEGPRSVLTGFKDLDQTLGGLQNGHLVILAARPSVGKSALAVNIADHVASSGKPVAFFSLEMSDWELGVRLLCSKSRVPWARVRDAKPDMHDWQALTDAMGVVDGLPLTIIDSGYVTVADVRAKARRMAADQGIGLVVVDYLQLMSDPGRSSNRNEEVSTISRGLKLLAKELNVPVLALSQLNRAMEVGQRRPRLSDLRDSGSLEQDADVVAFLHRDPTVEHDLTTECIIAKHRNGPTGVVRLTFLPQFTQFADWAGEAA